MNIVIATDNRFWRESLGSQMRIAAIFRYLVGVGYTVRVLFVGVLVTEDKLLLENFSPRISLQSTERAHTAPRARTAPRIRARLPRWLRLWLREIRHILIDRPRRIGRRNVRRRATKLHIRLREHKLGDFVSAHAQALLREMCRETPPDAVIVEYVHLGYLIQGLRSSLPSLAQSMIDTIDVMHERQERFHERGEPHAFDISPEEEAAVLSAFDTVIAIHQEDRRKLRSLVPNTNIIEVGHVSRLEAVPLRHEFPVRLLFLGSDMTPNKQGVEDLLRLIWPRLRARFGEGVELWIAGSVSRWFDASAAPEGVRILGFVQDSVLLYHDVDIVVNPVRFGGGLKIKSVEALCHAKPLVTTPVGAEGLDGANNAFVICELESMAEELASLISDRELRERLSNAALKFAQTRFAEATVFRELEQTLIAVAAASSRKEIA
jgi:glycosyltransferase involved in cell wall biosynthesis